MSENLYMLLKYDPKVLVIFRTSFLCISFVVLLTVSLLHPTAAQNSSGNHCDSILNNEITTKTSLLNKTNAAALAVADPRFQSLIGNHNYKISSVEIDAQTDDKCNIIMERVMVQSFVLNKNGDYLGCIVAVENMELDKILSISKCATGMTEPENYNPSNFNGSGNYLPYILISILVVGIVIIVFVLKTRKK